MGNSFRLDVKILWLFMRNSSGFFVFLGILNGKVVCFPLILKYVYAVFHHVVHTRSIKVS